MGTASRAEFTGSADSEACCKETEALCLSPRKTLGLFDEPFQRELIDMYRRTGAGKPPLPPAMLAMATLLQAYSRVADHEAVELTADSKRWQMVLDCVGAEEPLFSQGAQYDFRMRLMNTEMDRRLVERTVELARKRMALATGRCASLWIRVHCGAAAASKTR